MRLNNHGWGLREMLFFSAIIFLCVLLVAFLINNLYKDFENMPATTNNSNYAYSEIETNLKNSAERYYKYHQNEVGEIILSEDLIDEGYLTEKKMKTKNDICSGYVMVETDFTPYITCQNYETEGY